MQSLRSNPQVPFRGNGIDQSVLLSKFGHDPLPYCDRTGFEPESILLKRLSDLSVLVLVDKDVFEEPAQ